MLICGPWLLLPSGLLDRLPLLPLLRRRSDSRLYRLPRRGSVSGLRRRRGIALRRVTGPLIGRALRGLSRGIGAGLLIRRARLLLPSGLLDRLRLLPLLRRRLYRLPRRGSVSGLRRRRGIGAGLLIRRALWLLPGRLLAGGISAELLIRGSLLLIGGLLGSLLRGGLLGGLLLSNSGLPRGFRRGLTLLFHLALAFLLNQYASQLFLLSLLLARLGEPPFAHQLSLTRNLLLLSQKLCAGEALGGDEEPFTSTFSFQSQFALPFRFLLLRQHLFACRVALSLQALLSLCFVAKHRPYSLP